MRVSKQLPVLLNWYGNILLLQQILTADMNNFDGCFPPTGFRIEKRSSLTGSRCQSYSWQFETLTDLVFHSGITQNYNKWTTSCCKWFEIIKLWVRALHCKHFQNTDKNIPLCFLLFDYWMLIFFKLCLFIAYQWSSMFSLTCASFLFSSFYPSILFAWPPHPLLPVFMHGTWWEELEPPSCHSSRLQFD